MSCVSQPYEDIPVWPTGQERSIASAWYSWSLPCPAAIEANSSCTSPPELRGGSRVIPPAHPQSFASRSQHSAHAPAIRLHSTSKESQCEMPALPHVWYCPQSLRPKHTPGHTSEAFKPSLPKQAELMSHAVTCGASSQKMQ